MTFEEHLTEFAGLPVVDFPAKEGQPVAQVEPDAVAWRLRTTDIWRRDGTTYREFETRFAEFLERVDTSRVRALVIGMTAYQDQFDSETAVELLAAHAAAFPELRAIFFGDVVREESDVAYIEHSDLMPILEAYPQLVGFHVRGSDFMPEKPAIRPFRHDALRVLVFESGGLSPAIIRNIGECEIPELEHLEFYFGDEEYGGGAEISDIAWLLSGEKFPKLSYLGLRNAPNQNEIAAALAHAPIVARLRELDLSLGTLGDEGVAALLAGQPLSHLESLDCYHNYISPDMAQRLRDALPGVEVDTSGEREPDEWDGEQIRYIAISE